jgi:hypothetical protein
MADAPGARPATAVGMRALLRLAATGMTPPAVQTQVERTTQDQRRESTVAQTVVETAGRRLPQTAVSAGPAPAAPRGRMVVLFGTVAVFLLIAGVTGVIGLVAFSEMFDRGGTSSNPPTGPANAAAPATTTPPTPPPPSIPKLSNAKAASLCANIFNTYECAKAVERFQLGQAEYKPYAARSGKSLELTLRNGGRVTFLDAGKDADSVFYCLREYLPEVGYFVLHRQYYEGNSYVLVDDRQGSQFDVNGLPVVSPDLRRMVMTSFDLEAGYLPNMLLILRRDDAGLQTEASFSPQDWGPSDAVWVDGETIRFTMNHPTNEPGSYRKVPGRAVFRGGKWALETGV